MFLEHGNIPGVMQEYYIDVFNRGKVDYLNSFLLNYGENENTTGDKANSKIYVKATEAGREYAKEEREKNKIVNLDEYRNKKNGDLWKPYEEKTAISKNE